MKQILPLAKKIIKRLLGTGLPDKRVKKLYEEKEYLDAYSQHTDLRVESDPHSAVGGNWEKIGRLQFEFLVNKGLQPHHTILDIGCGTLRGGRHFIKYLHTGNYCGIDISPKAIDYGKQLVQQEGSSDKNPRLLVNNKRDLGFRVFSGETFDFILAQSVFTHLKPEHIEECFENIDHIMHGHSVFYFTYSQGEEYKRTSLKGFQYPFSFFQSLAEQHGFSLQDCSNEYNHPRGQRMLALMKK